MPETVKLKQMADFHIHLREGKMLDEVLPYTVKSCQAFLAMPNLTPPILTQEDASAYHKKIFASWAKSDSFFEIRNLRIFTSIKLLDSTTPETIKACSRESGTIAGKLYPVGVTTNSQDGVTNIKALYPVFKAMEETGMVLCLHAESPDVEILEREIEFLQRYLLDMLSEFPKLKIVVEHVSDWRSVEYITALNRKNLAATITLHHLLLTLDDVIGNGLQSHYYCKPVAKTMKSKRALVEKVLVGDPQFFLGSDSAPHTIEKKECACGAAGVYSAPVLAPALFEFFHDYLGDTKRASMAFNRFTSEYGMKFYGFESVNSDPLELEYRNWTVPDVTSPGAPKSFLAGQTLKWTQTST